MLDKDVQELAYEDGKVVGVTANGEGGPQTAKCKMVICDPSYAPGLAKKTGQVRRKLYSKASLNDFVDHSQFSQGP